MAPKFDPLTPMWWVHRLHKQLVARCRTIDRLDDYYCGNHPLPWLAEQAQDEFRRVLKMTRSNYMGLVIDAQVERQVVEGFRLDPNAEQADPETWDIWKANNLDVDFDKGILEAGIAGQSYLLVAPNPDAPATPYLWVEHPSQTIVEHVPGTNRRARAAGLKLWMDDWTGLLNATLYLPDSVHKFTAEKSNNITPENARWRPRQVTGEEFPAPNTMDEVPLFECPNNPRLLTGGVSELIDVTDIQDRINKTLADRLMTQDYGAFPQKWATGYPEVDEQGRDNPPIDIGRDRLVKTDVQETRFGQWDAADLDPYSAAKKEDVKDIASRTRTPAQYLLSGDFSNVNGETLKASESGLVSKVRQRNKGIQEGPQGALRLARRVAGLADVPVQTIWRNPEFRTEGETVDALVKMSTLGVPFEALWERWGATPEERARWKVMLEEQQADPVLCAALRRAVDAQGSDQAQD